jgi:hypothetical protein
MQWQQMFLRVTLDDFDDGRQELLQASDGDVTSGERGGGADVLLFCCEVLDRIPEDLLLVGYIAIKIVW